MLQGQLQRLQPAVVVHLEPIDGLDTPRHILCMAEEHRIEVQALAREFEPRVPGTDNALLDHIERIEEARLGKALTPHTVGDRRRDLKCCVVR